MSKSRCLIHAEKYERLEAAVKEMNTPYHSASDFVRTQIDEVLEKYDKWLACMHYNILFKEASGEESVAQIQAFGDFWH